MPHHDDELRLICVDFLIGNPHLYAHKAKRKSIGLIHLQIANRGSSEVRVPPAAAELVVDGKAFSAAHPEQIIRKFTEFTWDFLFWAILVFNPVLFLLDILFFLSGPLYNRRLRRQLHLLSDRDLIIQPGKTERALLGFSRISKGPMQLRVLYERPSKGQRELLRAVSERVQDADLLGF